MALETPNKKILFDSGPLISLTTNNLLWTLEKLSNVTNTQFFITPSVKNELITKPLNTKRFEFEAFQITRELEKETLNLFHDIDKEKSNQILNKCNSLFFANGKPLHVVHKAEIETLVTAVENNISLVVIDEKIARIMVENPEHLRQILQKRLHTKVELDKNNLKFLKKYFSNIKIIRSTELMTICFELGLFDDYLRSMNKLGEIPEEYLKKTLLDSILWGLKLRGVSISREEIKLIGSNIFKNNS